MSTFTAGYYVGHIQKWNLSEAGTGNPQFVINFIPAYKKGPKGAKEECPNDPRSVYRVITDKTIEYFANDLKALGYDRDTFDDLDPTSPNAFNFEGIEIEVRMKLETYDGRERERWELAMVKTEIKPLERQGISALNAQFANKLRELRMGGSGTAQARTPAPAAATGYANNAADDDVPF